MWRLETKNLNIEFTDKKITHQEILDYVTIEDFGANVIFLGTIRKFNNAKEVSKIFYDVYHKMALQKCEKICMEYLNEDIRICVRHFYGEISPSEIGFAVGISSRCRKNVFKITSDIVERVKHSVPIWKREFYADGTNEWLVGCKLC